MNALLLALLLPADARYDIQSASHAESCMHVCKRQLNSYSYDRLLDQRSVPSSGSKFIASCLCLSFRPASEMSIWVYRVMGTGMLSKAFSLTSILTTPFPQPFKPERSRDDKKT